MAFPVGSHNLFITRPDFVYNEPALYDRDTMGVARFYEEILNSNPESAQSEEMIYVKAQIAVSYRLLGATGSAIEIAQEIQAQLSDMDIRDSKFDSMLDSWEATLQEEAVKAAASEVTAKTFQAWKPTKDHPFPNHLTIPTGHERLKSRWQSMFFHGSEKFDALLVANAIETHHIESTFFF
ncbi:hypothetical protein C8F01DRAFT_698478 [Mycena amicta]|nr:hypothetical protein C8F01DRAFT_698478 [Mycena amicta]